jgi:hypothetical protein
LSFHVQTDRLDTPYRTATSPTADPSSTSMCGRYRCSTCHPRILHGRFLRRLHGQK